MLGARLHGTSAPLGVWQEAVRKKRGGQVYSPRAGLPVPVHRLRAGPMTSEGYRLGL